MFTLIGLSIFVSVAIGANYIEVRLPSTGTVYTVVEPVPLPGLEIFWEQECVTPVTEIKWGQIDVGGQKTEIIYLKNTGDMDLTLSIITENWTPSEAVNYISISWNRETSTIPKDQILQAEIVLTVSNSITGISDFSFNIIISGSK